MVFSVKGDEHKVWLVRECEQYKSDFDYGKIYSPVVNGSSLRMVIALAGSREYHTKFDVKTAFLNEELTMYIYGPDGYEGASGKICKLTKALYGLKQASVQWNKKFTEVIEEKGLEKLKMENCIFEKRKSSLGMVIYGWWHS